MTNANTNADANANAVPETPDSPNLKLTFSSQGRKKSLSKGQRTSEIVEFARTKSQSAWSSVKVKLMKQTSTPELWRKWSARRLSGAPAPDAAARSREAREARWPDDAEHSLFCESLLGVMRRCGRFNYLSGSDDQEKRKEKEMEKQKEVEMDNDKDKGRRRRSLLNPLRANRNASRTI